MVDPTTEPTPSGLILRDPGRAIRCWLGSADGQALLATILRDPGRAIRCWVAFFLRIGIGLSLLSTGLAGYFNQQGRAFGGGGWNQGLPFSGLDPFFAALPYLAIGIGLALILGFLTTASAIASAFFSLLTPIFAIIQIITAGSNGGMPGVGRWGNDPFSATMMSMLLPSLIPQAALIWFSPLENHPYSVDTLIFGRNEIEMEPQRASPAPGGVIEPEPQPEAEPVVHIAE